MLIYDGGKFSEPSPCHMSQEEWDHYENAKTITTLRAAQSVENRLGGGFAIWTPKLETTSC